MLQNRAELLVFLESNKIRRNRKSWTRNEYEHLVKRIQISFFEMLDQHKINFPW